MKENQYITAMDNIDIPLEMKRRVISRITPGDPKERNYILKENNIIMSKKKFALVTAALVMVLCVPAFAASGIITSWFSSSSTNSDYKSLPTVEQAVKDVGYAPLLIECFSNGYTFNNGNIVSNDFKDDSNNSIENFKSFTFNYAKDEDKILFSQKKFNSEIEISGDLISSENGIDIYFNGYTNKIVPPDYKLTEADKEAEKNGELVFSYGSSEVSVSEVKGVTWKMGDIYFTLMQIDGNLSDNDLVQMAKEIIEQNK